MALSGFCSDPLWNESLTWSNNEDSWPQFTHCFEDTVLVWIPCGWLWISLPFYLAYLSYSSETAFPITHNTIAKTFFSIFLCVSSVVSIIDLATAGDVEDTSVLYLAFSIKIATYLLSILLVHAERRCGIITSGVQFVFWFLALISNIVPFYSKIIRKEYETNLLAFVLFYISFTLIFLELILFSFAEKVKYQGYFEIGTDKGFSANPCPEVHSSFLSRLTFWWINKLILTGYKKPLDESDLWDLHPRDQSLKTIPKFTEAWRKELQNMDLGNQHLGDSLKYDTTSEETPLLMGHSKQYDDVVVVRKKKHPSLTKVILKTFGFELLLSQLLKLLYDLLQFVSPLVLELLIAFTENKSEKMWKGFIYTLALFVTALIQSASYHQFFHISMTTGMRIKAALIDTVYQKALTINGASRSKTTIGQIVNLMAIDCERIQNVASYIYMLWSAPLQMILAVYFLWGVVKYAALAGLALMLLLIPINIYTTIKTRRYQVEQMLFKDSRLKLMNEILSGIKVLKLYAWEMAMTDKITKIRKKELDVLRKAAFLNAFSAFCFLVAPFMVTVVTFTTYILTREDHYMDAQTAFVALSLLNILRLPINMLPMAIPFIIQAHVAVVRITDFLINEDLDLNNVQHNPRNDNVVEIHKGTFTWDRNMNVTLKNINLEIPKGKLVAIVGQVGAGKSSLISAILGELEKLKGTVHIKGSIAYIPQEAWIQNATLRDNILFGSDMDLQRYEKVIDACALKPDLAILHGGDMIEIGEKGINLSGGQKQRVSLARAVYVDKEIYLLDDPLSSVDSHVGKHIFENVISEKGVLKNKTRLMVTHGVHWLPKVDSIVVLEDGQISEMGSYEELLSHDGAFSHFLKTYLTEELEDDDPEIQEIKTQILERVNSVISAGSDEDSLNLTSSSSMHLSSRSRQRIKSGSQSFIKSKEKEKLFQQSQSKQSKLVQEEKSETGSVKLSVFFKYIKAVGLWATFWIIFSLVIYQATNMFANVWLSTWTDDPFLQNMNNTNNPQYLTLTYTYLGVYGSMGIIQAFLVLMFTLLLAVKSVQASKWLHIDLLNNIIRCPMSFFDTTPIGRVVNRFSRDVDVIDNNLSFICRRWLQTILQTISTLIIISYSTPLFLAVVVPLGILYFLIQRIYIPTQRQLKRLESTTRSPIYTHFSETISGSSTIRAYDMSSRFILLSQNKVQKNQVYYFAGIASNRWLGFRLEFVGNCIVVAAALFAVLGRDTMTGGLVGLSVSYALQVTGSLNWMVRMSCDLETNIVSVERIKQFSEVPTEADWYIPSQRPPDNWPHEGTLHFQNYYTRYRPGLDLVLKGIKCQIMGKEKIGIVGRTGAGKSSLTVALFRLIEAAGGAIVIDGQDISQMGLHDLRSRLTILPQDPVLFSGSLRMNLDPTEKYTDDQLWQALELAHLKGFVLELPSQLQFECGENGQNMSVGQRQLVCLARTLLRKTKILILDEATAAVDMETDDLIQTTIRTEFSDCTVLTIAHRLNSVMDYDKIIVLEDGLISEFDTPHNLLSNRTSSFYKMAKSAGLV